MILKRGRYTVHEVYYDEDGEPWTCTEDPVCPEGNTPDTLREDETYQRALEWSALQYADLVPDYDPSAADFGALVVLGQG